MPLLVINISSPYGMMPFKNGINMNNKFVDIL